MIRPPASPVHSSAFRYLAPGVLALTLVLCTVPSRVIADDAPVDSGAAAPSDPQLVAMAATLTKLGWKAKTEYLAVKGTMGEEKVGTAHAEVVATLYETPAKALHEFEESFPPYWEANGRKVDVKVCPGRKVKMFSRADGFSSPEGQGYGQGVAIAETLSGRFEIRMSGASIDSEPLPQFVPMPLPERGEKLATEVETYVIPLLDKVCQSVP